MSNRIRLTLLLVSYCFIFWEEAPDAIAPLMFAVPYFTIPGTKVGVAQFAAWMGWISLVIALISFTERRPQRFTLAAKIGLALSACLFIAASSPITVPAISAIPFALAVVWPQRKPKAAPLPAAAAPPHR
jgi:hypothetical protein